MSDETLRELERTLAAEEQPDTRLRYGVALGRAGRGGEAVQILEPLLGRLDATGQRARVCTAAIYLESGESQAGLAVLLADFDESVRPEFAGLRARLEALLEEPALWGLAARAIGKLAPIGELVRVFRSVPNARNGRWAARSLLAAAIQQRDRGVARELAAAEPDLAVAKILGAEGTLVV